MLLRNGKTTVLPKFPPLSSRRNPLFKPSKLAPFVLQNAQFAEIIQRIIYYSIGLDPDDREAAVVVRLDSSHDIERDIDIQRSARGEQALLLRLVHSIWNGEVDRIACRFNVVILPRTNVSTFPPPHSYRLRRLFLDADRILPSELDHFQDILAAAPSLSRLHVRITLSDASQHEDADARLCAIVTAHLRNTSLRVLRWNGPPIDLLPCISTSNITSLVIDNPPSHSNVAQHHIVLNDLKLLVVFLSSTRHLHLPRSDIFHSLCRASLQSLRRLVVMSIDTFPFLDNFIDIVGPRLEYLFVREAINSSHSSLRPLPSMPHLTICTLMILTAKQLLTHPQISLLELQLFGFYQPIIQSPSQRRRFVRAIRALCMHIRANSDNLFRHLHTVRVIGLTAEVFRHAPWSPLERWHFKYSARQLSNIDIKLVADDGSSLLPAT